MGLCSANSLRYIKRDNEKGMTLGTYDNVSRCGIRRRSDQIQVVVDRLFSVSCVIFLGVELVWYIQVPEQ